MPPKYDICILENIDWSIGQTDIEFRLKILSKLEIMSTNDTQIFSYRN